MAALSTWPEIIGLHGGRKAATVRQPRQAGFAHGPYEQMGFCRCTELDLSASDMGLGDGGGGVRIIAYRLDLV